LKHVKRTQAKIEAITNERAYSAVKS
jgi:hypothetical protein